MYFLLFCVSSLTLLLALHLDGLTQLVSFYQWCTAGNEFREWRDENPNVYVGLSSKGKALLTELIIAYDRYLLLHPDVNDHGYRDNLMSLFDDIPPRPNKPSPPYVLTKNPTICWGFIFVIS